MSYKNDYFQCKVFSLFQISLKSEEKSENRARDDAVFWISILSLHSHPQLSSRKGNETQDDRKAFPEVKLCCHHGLFTVSVSMATP